MAFILTIMKDGQCYRSEPIEDAYIEDLAEKERLPRGIAVYKQESIPPAILALPLLPEHYNYKSWLYHCKLIVIPLDLGIANTFVTYYHRHNKAVPGAKFCIGIVDDSKRLRGVAIVGRPVSRHLQDGVTLEVCRCCTDGVPNGCSILYAATRKAAFAMGYVRIITYTLSEESGISLRASGWTSTYISKPSTGWLSRPNRQEQQIYNKAKLRWETNQSTKTGWSISYPWSEHQNDYTEIYPQTLIFTGKGNKLCIQATIEATVIEVAKQRKSFTSEDILSALDLERLKAWHHGMLINTLPSYAQIEKGLHRMLKTYPKKLRFYSPNLYEWKYDDNFSILEGEN